MPVAASVSWCGGMHSSLTPPDKPWLLMGLNFSARCPAVFVAGNSVPVPRQAWLVGEQVFCTVSPQPLCGSGDKGSVSLESPAVKLGVVGWATLSGSTRI